MHLLDKEYKSGVKEDIAALGKLMNARFDKIDTRFEAIDARFQTIDDRLSAHDKRFDAQDNKIDKGFSFLDNKIDLKTAELRTDIHKSNVVTLMWMIGFIITLLLLFIGATWFKK